MSVIQKTYLRLQKLINVKQNQTQSHLIMLNEKKIVFLFTKKNFIVKDKKKSFIIIIIFLLEFGPDKLTSFISSLVYKLDFISQPSSKSTLPLAGLQHMQQCKVNFQPIFAPGF